MIPPEPLRSPQLGFLYFPPYRVQGYSVAGEETFVQIPELGVCFDIGRSRRTCLTSDFVALTHGHMDHAAGLAYYFSQRHFQGMGAGTLLCHPALESPIRRLMEAWIDIEAQRTPYRMIAMTPGTPTEEVEVKNNIYLRAFETDHTVPSLGFVALERRSKLKAELMGLPQEKLLEMKAAGEQITYMVEIPLAAYLGDTGPGAHFDRPDVREARILITECTFLDENHRERARVGKHLHLEDLAALLPNMKAEAIVLTHLSRRLHLGQARVELDKVVSPADQKRIFFLMDSRANKQRYQQQQTEDAEQEGDEEKG